MNEFKVKLKSGENQEHVRKVCKMQKFNYRMDR